MKAAGQLTPPVRAALFRSVIGLMATTGLRLGEALGLDRHDVDLTDGALHVRAGKAKQREVPLHPTATTALREYARCRERYWPQPSSSAFFLNLRGERLTQSEFNHRFTKLIRQVGLEGAGERTRPRPHEYADVRVMPMSLRRGCSARFRGLGGRHNQSAWRKASRLSVGR